MDTILNNNKCDSNSFTMAKGMYFILLLPFFKPISLGEISVFLDQLYDFSKIIALFIVALLYIIRLAKEKRIHSILLALVLLHSMLLISNIINHNADIWVYFVEVGSSLGLCMLTLIMLEEYPLFLIKSLVAIHEIWIYLNLITLFLYPNGMYLADHFQYITSSNWLLSYRNHFILFFLPGITLAVLRSYCINGREKLDIRSLALISACFISVFLAWSATTFMALSVFTLFLFLPHWIKKVRIFNIRTYIFITITIFLFLVVFRLQDMFALLIEGILGRNLTLSGRTYIWDRAIYWISLKPWIGYGRLDGFLVSKMLLNLPNAHNQFLEFFFQGGILYAASFGVILAIVGKACYKYRDHYMVKVISFALFAIMIEWQAETIGLVAFIPIFVIASCAKEIAKSN